MVLSLDHTTCLEIHRYYTTENGSIYVQSNPAASKSNIGVCLLGRKLGTR